MDHNKYAKKFTDKWGTEYELLSEYDGSSNKIKMRHVQCGAIIEKSASEALRYGCVHCSRKANVRKGRASQRESHKLTENFIMRLQRKFGTKYSLIGDYVDAKTATRLKCECGREFYVRPDDLIHGQRGCDCVFWKARKEAKLRRQIPKPKPEPLWTHDKYVNKVKEIWGDEFEVVGTLVNMSTPLLVRHNRCGDEHLKDPYSLLRNHGCSKCSRNSLSSGVILIMGILDEMGIQYEREVKLKGCKNKRTLPFDFGIYQSNRLIALIEYDGEQHFKPIKSMGGMKKFEQIRQRDKIKQDYCRRQGIPLIRIPFKMVERTGKRAYEIVKEEVRKGLAI